MKGLLVAGGKMIDKKILYKYKECFIVCADSGIKNFIDTEMVPDIVVGDFDSIDDMGTKFIRENNIKVEAYPAEKNFTDLEVAFEILLEKNVQELIILSAIGTRMDHSLGNILLLERAYGKTKAKIIDDNNEIVYVKKGRYGFLKDDYTYISVISITDELEYSTKGLKYETDHLIITRTSIRGVSNEIENNSCEIEIHSGEGFIIKSKD